MESVYCPVVMEVGAALENLSDDGASVLLVFDGAVSGMHAEQEIGLGPVDRREMRRGMDGGFSAFDFQLGDALKTVDVH